MNHENQTWGNHEVAPFLQERPAGLFQSMWFHMSRLWSPTLSKGAYISQPCEWVLFLHEDTKEGPTFRVISLKRPWDIISVDHSVAALSCFLSPIVRGQVLWFLEDGALTRTDTLEATNQWWLEVKPWWDIFAYLWVTLEVRRKMYAVLEQYSEIVWPNGLQVTQEWDDHLLIGPTIPIQRDPPTWWGMRFRT